MARADALMRGAVIALSFLALWAVVCVAFAPPAFLLPTPWAVASAFVTRFDLLLMHAGITALEIVLGLVLGAALGLGAALLMAGARGLRPWLLPVLVGSQAIPVFALAPVLVIWLGYGLASKVAMAVLIVFFPVAAAAYDGLRRAPPGWLDLARVMAPGAGSARLLRFIRLPAALPAAGSGLRMAAAVAPIGAVVGEWVGSSAGLGFLMLHANARLQTDLMFAALLLLIAAAVALYYAMDWAVRRLTPWQTETLDRTERK